jgi:hypothetical protein
MSAMRSRRGPAQAFCLVAGVVLLTVGLAGPGILHIVTGVLLLAGAPSARAARVVCALCFATYIVVAAVGWIDILPLALALAALVAAAAPAPARHRAAGPGLPPAGSAYDASSAKQLFVGLRD